MDVTTGHRITDAEKLVLASRVIDERLRTPGDQRRKVHFSQVGRSVFEFQVQVRYWQRAVFNHHLIDHALDRGLVVFVVKGGDELTAARRNFLQAIVQRERSEEHTSE